jgi:hypothetical protein
MHLPRLSGLFPLMLGVFGLLAFTDTLQAQSAPIITTQPASQTVTTGQIVVLTVSASGTPAPTFQWKKDGVNPIDYGRIFGVTVNRLLIVGATIADAGSYTVVITNSLGTVTSSAAVLSVDATSGAGLNWTSRSAGLTNSLLHVTWSGSQFLTVGSGGAILTSSDGINWISRNSGTSASLVGVAWSGSQFVVVGDGGTILTSGDGINWISRNSGTTKTLLGVTWCGNQFVAVGVSGTILASVDGISWSIRSSVTGRDLIEVSWNGTLFVAVGVEGAVLTSVDGVSWTILNIDPWAVLYAVTWSGNRFVAVGKYGAISTSTDGVNWTSLNIGWYEYDLYEVMWNGSQFVAAGELGVVATSIDGINWKYFVTVLHNELYGVAWNGNRFVITGNAGTILTLEALAVAQPTITTQPLSVPVTVGQNATFTVAASGTPAPGYQWLKDGVNLADGGRISGATTATLQITGVSIADAGSYTVVITNSVGSVTSSAAVLTIIASTPYTFTTLAGTAGGSNGVAVDGFGNVYVADDTIRKITNGGGVTTLAGTTGVAGSADGTGSAAQFNRPAGVAVDSAGNLYVAELGNNTIRKITSGGVVTTLAGTAGIVGSADGTGSAAQFNQPYGLAVDNAGNVYVADTYNSTIRKVTPDGVVTTLAGLAGNTGSADGTGSAARFGRPTGVAVNSTGNVYVADSNGTVRKITSNGVVTTLAGTAGIGGSADGTGSAAQFMGLNGIAVDNAGNVYVTDPQNYTIRKITSGGVVTTLAGMEHHWLIGVAVDSVGNVYVADTDPDSSTILWGASAPPVLTSAIPANWAVGQGFTYALSFNGALPGSYTATGLPGGLSLSPSTGVISGTPTAAGTFPATVGATNGAGTVSATLTFTIAQGSQTISFGALANKTYGDADFSVSATSTSGLAPNFSIVSGPATISGATVHLTGVGSVVVRASQVGDTIYASAPVVDRTFSVAKASLTATAINQTRTYGAANPALTVSYSGFVNGDTAAAITAPTAGTTATAASGVGSYPITLSGGSAANYTLTLVNGTLSITKAALAAKADDKTRIYGAAEPTFTISYTGFVNGDTAASITAPTASTAATSASLPGTYPITLAGGSSSNYTFTLTNGTLTVTPRDYSGTYFGTFTSGGSWALYVRADSTATYIAYLPSRSSVIFVSLTVGVDGSFTVTSTEIVPLSGAVNGFAASALPFEGSPRRTAAAASSFTLTGQIGINGAISGTLAGLGTTFSGAVGAATGPAASLAGLYRAAALGTAGGATYAIVGASGQAVVITTTPTSVGGATGTVNGSGQFTATTSSNAQLSLTINASAHTINASLTPAGTTSPITYFGLADTVTPNGYLANLSVRAAMAAGQTLIVGFVVDGGAKPMLVRAAGPVLNKYGLTGVVDPQLKLFNGSSTQVAANDNWDAALATTFATLGAFPFDAGSKDAALQQTINGPHTAQATATGAGAILVEAYDAGPNDGRKLVNLSARFQVGIGDNILIAGFVLSGTGTRQLLIRAVGPTLTNYGVTGVLADPQLAVFDVGTSIASNNDWSASLSSTFTTLGAFALNAGSKDAALVVTLQAGKPYSVQVSGVGNTTGEALVEIYLIP